MELNESAITQQAQAYQAPSTQAPVTYSRFEAYTKANDATLNNLQKNLNDFKKEQQDFQNEQRNFQNMMLNMFQKQMGNSNALKPFLRTARVLIDVHGEELVIRDGMERIVFKPDGSQDKESIHMMDIYDDRVKNVCEPKNDESSTSTIVEEFESLLGDIIRQKEEVKGISDPVAKESLVFIRCFKDQEFKKRLAPSKALLTLDVFDPLHPPLMDFHVTKAFSRVQ
ncbi:hypothetical protein Tco_0281279 [Tanacetum coccineum]